jgi:hypothetical protein
MDMCPDLDHLPCAWGKWCRSGSRALQTWLPSNSAPMSSSLDSKWTNYIQVVL